MSAARGPRAGAADVARQARELLLAVRESRWPGFAAREAGAATAAAPPQRAAGPVSTARSAAPRPAPPATVTAAAWASLEEVAAAVAGCTRCKLHASRRNAVPGEGSPRARLMFVGEAPGADEDAQGRPFVGKAGQLLDKMIGAMGLARGEVFIANVLKCRPPGNRDPEPDEVAACLPYLHAQLALVRPEAICSLGRHSAQALLDSKEPIGRLRGRFYEYRGTPLLPTFHPSYLLRSPGEKVTAWKDLQEIMRRLGIELPRRAAGEAAEGGA